jgi:hypothetical protein
MRHVLSFLTGVVVAPLIWVAVAAGQGATQIGFPDQGKLSGRLMVGGLLLVGVGLVAGLIASLRTSPVAAIFAGTIYLGASVYFFFDHARALHFFTTSWKVKDYPIDMALPLTTGVLAFAGGMLIMSLFSGARWRGRSTEADDFWSPIPPEDGYGYR